MIMLKVTKSRVSPSLQKIFGKNNQSDLLPLPAPSPAVFGLIPFLKAITPNSFNSTDTIS